MRTSGVNIWGRSVSHLRKSSSRNYDPLAIAEQLIRRRSITPNEGGTLKVVEKPLKQLGFICNRVNFHGIDNLFAYLSGGDGEHFNFCGHVDVVPAAAEEAWSHPPFAARVENGNLYGRGAVDMKGAVACFIAAAADFVRTTAAVFDGTVSIMLTADEEGAAENGIRRLMPWLKENNKLPDFCLVGEPTSARVLGDQMRIGRRGSLRFRFKVSGTAGHSAWPERSDNPIPRLTALVEDFMQFPLGKGDEDFPSDTASITKIQADGGAANVTPHTAEAAANIRFGATVGSGKKLAAAIKTYLRGKGHRFEMETEHNAEPFVCKNERLTKLIQTAVFKHTRMRAERSCGGGTSDARYVTRYCPVNEFGLVGQTMHKVDEHCGVADLRTLTEIYKTVLADFFKKSPA